MTLKLIDDAGNVSVFKDILDYVFWDSKNAKYKALDYNPNLTEKEIKEVIKSAKTKLLELDTFADSETFCDIIRECVDEVKKD